MTNPFYRLAPFIQEFIYREKWGELRPVQIEAISAILDTTDHVLIASGTASGKTEAAFLPILTDLFENPSQSIGAMYVGPLKALINDQFYRLQNLLEHSDIPVQSWHGDVPQSKKQRFLRTGKGILQITPESLEAMLINRQTELSRLFGDLRYVVLDEVHALINSDRGRQVLCQLQRLSRYQARPARRIGLSATLGDPEVAASWLAGNDDLHVQHIADLNSGRQVLLGLEHFVLGESKEDDVENDQKADSLAEIGSSEMYEHMSQIVGSSRKTLIFANSRTDTEDIVHNLRRIAGVDAADEDGYYVHHGSISAAIREQAEKDMRDPDKFACIAATITLELGIDIGNLDQVLQVGTANTVSGFVQRLGRSGRRGGPTKMFFYTRDTESQGSASLGERIPWGFLQTIAAIQLYLEERWIEPPYIPRLPVNLLYHQTMSTLCSHTELNPSELAERVLTLSPFSHVSLSEFRQLLHYLIEINHMDRIEGGGLIIGHAAESIVNNFRFYATFEDEVDFLVRDGTREIGTIQVIPEIGARFRLAGRAWKVLEIDGDKKVIQVERVKGKAQALWRGGGVDIHARIIQRIRKVLDETVEYSYLHPKATERLRSARHIARISNISGQDVIDLGGNRFMILPWEGSKTVRTIRLLLDFIGCSVARGTEPYYLEVNATSYGALQQHIAAICSHPPHPQDLIRHIPRQSLMVNKYDRYVSEPLLRAAYCEDYLDMDSAIRRLIAIK